MRLGDKHRRLVKNGYSAYLKLSGKCAKGLLSSPKRDIIQSSRRTRASKSEAEGNPDRIPAIKSLNERM